MRGTKVLKSLAVYLAAGMLYLCYSGPALAQAAPADQDAKMRVLQQRIDDMSKQLKQMQDEQAKTEKTVSTVDKAWNTFIKGFFGTLDAPSTRQPREWRTWWHTTGAPPQMAGRLTLIRDRRGRLTLTETWGGWP